MTSCARIMDNKVDSISAGESTSICFALSDDSGCPVDLLKQSECEASLAAETDNFLLATDSITGPWKYHTPDCPTVVANSDSVFAAVTAQYLRDRCGDVCQCQLCLPDISVGGGNVRGDPAGFSFSYQVKSAYWHNNLDFRAPVTLLDASKARFRVEIPATAFRRPGVYLAELVWLNGSQERVGGEMRYLEVKPTLRWRNWGALTIAEIRMALRDYPCANTLIEDYEFSDHEIMFAIRRPVDWFNEMTPTVGLWDVTTFPWREHQMKCTIGLLMQTAAAAFRRNDMTYQASTLSIHDQNKHPVYEQVAQSYINEFKMWAKEMKRQINIERGWGTLFGTPYDAARGFNSAW